jgi:hypothetical protein
MREDELAAHLATLVGARLLDPLEILLGDELVTLRRRVGVRARVWARQLLGPDDALAVAATGRLIGALYPGDQAFDPPAEWWRTPLGQVVARRAGHPGAVAVSYAVAGAMLGVTRLGVHALVVRGKLDRHPDGGATTASVRARLRSRSALIEERS